MSPASPEHPIASPTNMDRAAEIQSYVERLLGSPLFKATTRRAQLFRYLVERSLGPDRTPVNEYSIGVDVFGKPSSFDPRTESVVRNEAMRLRQKLAAYYESDGARDPVRIEIAKRSYAVEITFPEAVAPVLPVPVEAIPAMVSNKGKWVFAGLVAIALCLLAIIAGQRVLPGFHRPAKTAANMEAQDLYLKGRYYWDKRSADSLPKAIDYYTQSIVRDPGYAQAYAGLADCYNLLPEYSSMPPSEAFPRALKAAERAVELDGSSAQAHASLAFASAYGMWDFRKADQEFRRAIALDPNYVQAHHWRANLLTLLNREVEAFAEIERARQLDPVSNSILADKGLIMFRNGAAQEAIALLQQVQSADPSFPSTYRNLSVVYFELGRYDEWLQELKVLAPLLHDPVASRVTEQSAKAYAEGGLPGLLQAQENLYREGVVNAFSVAETRALLGEKRKAIEYLTQALAKRDLQLLGIRIDRSLNSLRGEPRFEDISRSVLDRGQSR